MKAVRKEHKDIEQGTKQWINIRLGVFTSSEIFHLFSEPRSKKDKDAGLFSKTAETYIIDKAKEIIYRKPAKELDFKALAWGRQNEPYAVEAYEQVTGFKTSEMGFVSLGFDTGTSIDRYVNGKTKGLLEVKCPFEESNHIKNVLRLKSPSDLLKHSKQYYYQCQHQMYITGRKWCDFVSFEPRILDTDCNWNKCIKILRIPFDETILFEQKIKVASDYRDYIVKSML